MQTFSFENTNIKDLIIINPFFIEDDRGNFLKSYEKQIFEQNGINSEIFEDFETISKRGVIRGLHFQTHQPQAKIVRVVLGKIFDVAVDLRLNSTSFGQWQGFYMSEHTKQSLYIPKGFAHGFLVLSKKSLVSYKCVGQFLPQYDTGIIWNDETLKIEWPVEGINEITVSEKDSKLQTFEQFKNNNS